MAIFLFAGLHLHPDTPPDTSLTPRYGKGLGTHNTLPLEHLGSVQSFNKKSLLLTNTDQKYGNIILESFT